MWVSIVAALFYFYFHMGTIAILEIVMDFQNRCLRALSASAVMGTVCSFGGDSDEADVGQ